jgi:hypothetical protein
VTEASSAFSPLSTHLTFVDESGAIAVNVTSLQPNKSSITPIMYRCIEGIRIVKKLGIALGNVTL